MKDQAEHNQPQAQKTHKRLSIAAVIFIVPLIIFALAVYLRDWDWTALPASSLTWTVNTLPTTTGPGIAHEEQADTTLWAFLPFLGIIALALAVARFTLRTQETPGSYRVGAILCGRPGRGRGLGRTTTT